MFSYWNCTNSKTFNTNTNYWEHNLACSVYFYLYTLIHVYLWDYLLIRHDLNSLSYSFSSQLSPIHYNYQIVTEEKFNRKLCLFLNHAIKISLRDCPHTGIVQTLKFLIITPIFESIYLAGSVTFYLQDIKHAAILPNTLI